MDNSLEKTYKMVALGSIGSVDIQKQVKLFDNVFKNNEENSNETISESHSPTKEISDSIQIVIFLKYILSDITNNTFFFIKKGK